ncbi:hypothetical protein Rleg2_2394 [Rhizobium leguminosarum bv. trifolii WSM2304]|uniref:CopG family transcriptional regulator n=1 Tax=Rhizobium leguminosarum bv. trifolii (strain WSM2304) TaxID=395492 RepID=A0ABF7QP30_RHILW|nr:hypothetical protein Rleg2_2394 [Rhizobium leguminosarum bv. trifolii WSM2304]
MTATDTATILEDAADRIADISRPDLQTMLRRAALRLRNAAAVSMDDEVEEVLRDLAGELGLMRNDTIRFIVREWMKKNIYCRCTCSKRMALLKKMHRTAGYSAAVVQPVESLQCGGA